MATIECRVIEKISGGTHTVFLAQAEVAQAREGMLLTCFRGKMGRFANPGDQHPSSLWRDMQWEDAA